jgi:hypothetical protein
MRAGQLSLDEQMTCLRDALDRNQTLGAVLSGAAALHLPGGIWSPGASARRCGT